MTSAYFSTTVEVTVLCTGLSPQCNDWLQALLMTQAYRGLPSGHTSGSYMASTEGTGVRMSASLSLLWQTASPFVWSFPKMTRQPVVALGIPSHLWYWVMPGAPAPYSPPYLERRSSPAAVWGEHQSQHLTEESSTRLLVSLYTMA